MAQRQTRSDGSVWEWDPRSKTWFQVQGPIINKNLKVEKVEKKKPSSR